MQILCLQLMFMPAREDKASLAKGLEMKIAFIFLRFIFSLPEPFGIF
jgi:hypothetical protein